MSNKKTYDVRNCFHAFAGRLDSSPQRSARRVAKESSVLSAEGCNKNRISGHEKAYKIIIFLVIIHTCIMRSACYSVYTER